MKKLLFAGLAIFFVASLSGLGTNIKSGATIQQYVADDSTEVVYDDSYLADDSCLIDDDSVESLNDIRFANFTERDWFVNDYIRTVREYIDSYNRGEIEDEELEKYKDLIQGQFVIGNVEPFMLGGLFIRIVFINNPEFLFETWVYSDVDRETRTITGYHYEGIKLSDMKLTLTKEEIFKTMKERPELMAW